jgi:hypothetical protein
MSATIEIIAATMLLQFVCQAMRFWVGFGSPFWGGIWAGSGRRRVAFWAAMSRILGAALSRLLGAAMSRLLGGLYAAPSGQGTSTILPCVWRFSSS